MSRIKPFRAPSYSQRHGSPDKVPMRRFAELADYFEITCPTCSAILCVDAALLAVSPEIDCAGCGQSLAVDPDGALRPQDYDAVAEG